MCSRASHTEAGCDLARLAGAEPAAVICGSMNEDGTMARLCRSSEQFAAEHDFSRSSTIADLIPPRTEHESTIPASGRVPAADRLR